jgi:hypothetical protein
VSNPDAAFHEFPGNVADPFTEAENNRIRKLYDEPQQANANPGQPIAGMQKGGSKFR